MEKRMKSLAKQCAKANSVDEVEEVLRKRLVMTESEYSKKAFQIFTTIEERRVR